MILHHFTSIPAAQRIAADGYLRPHAWTFAKNAPPVVWFTAGDDRATVYTGWHDEPVAVIARSYRFTVDLPDAEVMHWRDWLAASGRGEPLADCDPEVAAYKARWFVTTRPVPREEWIVSEIVVAGDALAAALEEQ